MIARDVHEGREELNFSTLNRYSTKQRLKKLKESREEVEEAEMPPWLYVPLHPDARLFRECSSDFTRLLAIFWRAKPR